MRRLLSRPRQPRHREAPGNRPTLLRGSAGSPGCTRRGGRKAEAFRIRWGQCPPSAHGRAVPGPEGRTPRWSAERRGILRKDAAAFPARGRGSWCACRRSAPSVCRGRRNEGVPGAFSTIRAIPLGCRLPGRERARATHLSTDCPQPDSCGLRAGARDAAGVSATRRSGLSTAASFCAAVYRTGEHESPVTLGKKA
jgi:hypothetical protein